MGMNQMPNNDVGLSVAPPDAADIEAITDVASDRTENR
jgi:hypothetical protein